MIEEYQQTSRKVVASKKLNARRNDNVPREFSASGVSPRVLISPILSRFSWSTNPRDYRFAPSRAFSLPPDGYQGTRNPIDWGLRFAAAVRL